MGEQDYSVTTTRFSDDGSGGGRRRCTSPGPSPSRRSARCRAPSASCRRSSCCWRWASSAPSSELLEELGVRARPARQRQGGQALHDLRRGRVRRRRRAPRPVADRVGDQRGPPVRAHGRPLPGRPSQRRAVRAPPALPEDGAPAGHADADEGPEGPPAHAEPGHRRRLGPAASDRPARGQPLPMPTFCRHNRFIERCPICCKTLPGTRSSAPAAPRAARAARACHRRRARGAGRPARRPRGESLRVRREGRAPGRRLSLGAVARPARLRRRDAPGRGDRLRERGGCSRWPRDPPGPYAEARALAGSDLERATWMCFLIGYLCDRSRARTRSPASAWPCGSGGDRASGSRLVGLRRDLDAIPLGPRTLP